MTGSRPSISQEDRVKELGHPKELFDKLHHACEEVKSTHESLPKIVERMESKRKLHECCAQIVLDVARLENQQK